MHLDAILDYCKKKKGTQIDFPFDDKTLVLKIGGKMYAAISMDSDPLRINLKCDPVYAFVLRNQFKSVIPGYYMNKNHWNTVIFDESIPTEELLGWIDDSYNLVFKNLRKTDRELINKG